MLDGLRNIFTPTFVPYSDPKATIPLGAVLKNEWFELWYQPQFDVRSLSISQAEGLARIRHPTWGIIPAAYFIPDDGDPHFRALSEFVIGRAIADWHYFVTQRGKIDLSINLPIAFLQTGASVKELCEKIPDHPAFDGLTVEPLVVVHGDVHAQQPSLELERRLVVRHRAAAVAADVEPGPRDQRVEAELGLERSRRLAVDQQRVFRDAGA